MISVLRLVNLVELYADSVLSPPSGWLVRQGCPNMCCWTGFPDAVEKEPGWLMINLLCILFILSVPVSLFAFFTIKLIHGNKMISNTYRSFRLLYFMNHEILFLLLYTPLIPIIKTVQSILNVGNIDKL